jgi:hypothetical protein
MNITPQQVKEFINDDRKVAEIGQLSRILKTKETMQEELAKRNLKRDS